MIGPVIMIAVFVLLGVLFSMGRGSFLIAGYNTMPKAQKDKYDARALCKFMGKMMFALSGSMVLWLLSDVFGQEWLFTAGIGLFAVIVIFVLIYMNTGNRFRK